MLLGSGSSATSSGSSTSSNSAKAPAPFFLESTFNVGDIIEYSTTEGCKCFGRYVSKLGNEGFDVEESDCMAFASSLIENAREVEWDIDGVGVTSMHLDPCDPDSKHVNLLTNHGELTIEQIKAFKESYIYINSRVA